MKILEYLERVADMQSTESLQKELTVLEAGNIFRKLSARYDVIEQTNILFNFVNDPDFKIVIKNGIQILEKQARELESLCRQYGLPLPQKPPAEANIVNNNEMITDKYIFGRIFQGIQSFLPVHMIAFQESYSPKLREKFKSFLTQEMNIYDKFLEYGKLKGWVDVPPKYRV